MTRGEFNLERDGGQYGFYLGLQLTAAQRRADKGLSLTTLGGEEVSISRCQRGLIEGVITAFIIPAGAYYLRRPTKVARVTRRGWKRCWTPAGMYTSVRLVGSCYCHS